MSKITKLIALMLAVIFALSLVACGGDSNVESNDPTTTVSGDEQPQETVSTKKGETTTTTKAKDNNKKTTKTTKKKIEAGVDNRASSTGALIERTTNKAGNASAKFVKSLNGFTLKILYPWENIYGEKRCQQAAMAAIAAVENEFGVKIDEEGAFNRYNENLASELSAKKCENHIYYAQGGFFPSYFEKRYIADLTMPMREAGVDFNDPWYISNAKGFLNIDGKQYGWAAYEDEYAMPFHIIYNSKLLKSKRLKDPAELAKQGKWTWDVLLDYSKKFKDDKNITGFGTCSPILLLEAMCEQYGTSLTKISRGAEPKSNITDSKVKAALTTLGEWTTGKTPLCDTFQGKVWTYPKTQLAEGKVAMYFGSHDDIQNLKGSAAQDDINIVPFPRRKGSKTYTGIASPGFVAFIPSVHQSKAAKILFIRNEYYRHNYRYVDRNFEYKWQTYFGDNKEAINNAAKIKFAKDGNKIRFCWTLLCESPDAGITTNTVISEVISGKSTAAQAINSKKNALTKTYSTVWSGHEITGNV